MPEKGLETNFAGIGLQKNISFPLLHNLSVRISFIVYLGSFVKVMNFGESIVKEGAQSITKIEKLLRTCANKQERPALFSTSLQDKTKSFVLKKPKVDHFFLSILVTSSSVKSYQFA